METHMAKAGTKVTKDNSDVLGVIYNDLLTTMGLIQVIAASADAATNLTNAERVLESIESTADLAAKRVAAHAEQVELLLLKGGQAVKRIGGLV
jgi:hypothetical protein